jgi:hypothetical protein
MTVQSTEYSTEEFNLVNHTDKKTDPQSPPKQTESDENDSDSSEHRSCSEDDEDSQSDEPLTRSVDFVPKLAPVKPNSLLFLITIDDIPTGYCATFEEAQEQMQTIANRVWINYIPDSNGGILQPQGADDELHIIGYSKFYLITYNRIFVRLRIVRVGELL